MLHIVFWEPEIPGNTGAAIRLSACTGSMLHLVRPLGFDMDDADVAYGDGAGLLLGRESVGLSEEAMSHPGVAGRVRITMVPGVRSLNLANSAAIVLYEAWRQLGFPGGA